MKIAIVGGGIFGCETALSISESGHQVHLFESNSAILTGASMVNQARVHTGMHYPRDFETAKNSFEAYDDFIKRYPHPVTSKIDQYYAISSIDSKTTAEDFIKHAEILGLMYTEQDPRMFFNPRTVDVLLKVPESTLDFLKLREFYLKKFRKISNLHIHTKTNVKAIIDNGAGVKLQINDESQQFDRVIVATYANLYPLLYKHISEIADDRYFQYEACEVVLGSIPELKNTGITIMDGDFWSTMPFGRTGLHSLTNVAKTPHRTIRSFDPNFAQQTSNLTSQHLEFTKAFSFYMRRNFHFKYVKSMYTIKTIARKSQITAARPTEIFLNSNQTIIGVFSGKIASSLEAADQIKDLIS